MRDACRSFPDEVVIDDFSPGEMDYGEPSGFAGWANNLENSYDVFNALSRGEKSMGDGCDGSHHIDRSRVRDGYNQSIRHIRHGLCS
jgi:hypothetical protein